MWHFHWQDNVQLSSIFKTACTLKKNLKNIWWLLSWILHEIGSRSETALAKQIKAKTGFGSLDLAWLVFTFYRYVIFHHSELCVCKVLFVSVIRDCHGVWRQGLEGSFPTPLLDFLFRYSAYFSALP